MFVKICGTTSEEDALLAVALGADAVGFVFAPSPRQVTPSLVADIVKRLPREIVTVGVFRNDTPGHVVEVVNGIGLRGAQLHGDESLDATRWVAERVPLTIRAFPAGHPEIRSVGRSGAQVLLVDAPTPGSGELFDWRLVEGVVDHAHLLVSGGLDAGNVAEAIARFRPWGVDVVSGVEASPGRKDPARLRAFMHAARSAEEALPTGGGGDDAADGDGGGIYDWEIEEGRR